MLIVQNSSITILVNKIFYQIKRKYKKSFSTCVVIIKTFKTGRNTLALESQLTLLYQITTKQNFDHTRMSSLSSFLGTYINKATVNLDASKSPHHKKDVILRFLRLSVFTILIVIVLFLIYRVRDLYHQHLKYQRLQRDEAEVS